MAVDHLPPQSTPFIGRDEELAEIAALLSDPACRLLSLVGPGGIGKTRLAIQAAAQLSKNFADGVYFVALQPLSSPDYLTPTLAEAVSFSFSGQQDPRQQLLSYLSAKCMLLVMDNFEHLVEAAELLPDILQTAPGIKILVTSRVVLDLQEEWIRTVQGLRYPKKETSQPIEAYSAIQLFAERARRVRANFSIEQERECIAQICRLVQGMPLALELAATWLKTLACAEIAEEIQHNLDFLATTLRNVPERHRNMRAVFEQSWRLLGPAEKEAFERLAIFQGRFHRQAAQAVAGADLQTLGALVDQSLLRVAPDGRYEIHELLKQFAAEHLGENSQEEEQAHNRHCSYYAEYLSRQEARLAGPEQLAAAAEIDTEIDNIRSAWRWAVEKGKADAAERSLGCLLIYNQMRTRALEGAEMFNQAVQRFEGVGGRLLGDLCVHAAYFEATRGNYEKAAGLYQKGHALLKDGCLRGSTAMALSGITFMRYYQGRPWSEAEVQAIFLAYLKDCRERSDRRGEAWLAYALGASTSYEHRYEESLDWLKCSLEIFKAQGDRWSSTYVLNLLGIIYTEIESYSKARRVLEESMEICQEVRDMGGVAFSLGQLAEIADRQEEYERSRQYLLEAVKIMFEMKQNPFIFWHLYELAESFRRVGEHGQTAQIFAFILSQSEDQETKDYIRPRLETLQAEMTPEIYAQAVQVGESTDMETLIQGLWDEFARSQDSAVQELPLHGNLITARQSLVEPLSPRELEVLAWIAGGLSNREIARKMVVTVGTVKKHINNIFGKMQVGSRTQAVARARELGIL